MKRDLVNSIDTLHSAIQRVRTAQTVFSKYSQEQIDLIFKAVAKTANEHRIDLAKLAVDETHMGVVEDKVIKNHYAAEYIYNTYKNVKTCGVIDEDTEFGFRRIADPVGVIGAIIPTTNPTSTTIYKILLSLKTRNGIIISPHPGAKKCTIETAKLLLEAAVKAGAPESIIEWIDAPTLEYSTELMKNVDLILATGGPGMVNAAYSSGKPAIGVGAGNTPAIIDDSADIILAVNSIIHSKTFDNGVICASEQSVIAVGGIYQAVKQEFINRGCYILKDNETDKVRKTIIKNGTVNPEIVGRSAMKIAELSGIHVPNNTKILIGEVEKYDISEEFAHEKLSPVLALYHADSFDKALTIAEHLIEDGGFGHTSSIYIDTAKNKDKLDEFQKRMKTCRILVNTPAAQGGLGDLYNFKMKPALTLGCGFWGGNSVSENVGVKHLLNIKSVAIRRDNMLWFKTPQRVYFKKGCLPFAFNELKNDFNRKRAFLVTDRFLGDNNYTDPIIARLEELGFDYQMYNNIDPDPTLKSATEGVLQMQQFKPDCIIAFGGGSAMDAAKIMWVLYEHPEADFMDMALRFMDIRKRVNRFPKMGEKAFFVAIPTSAGTGSEVTPFAVITDDKTGIKYPLADYELMPNMAIVDIDYHMSAPKGLTAASGIDALSHALEALASMMSSDYTDSMALRAIKMIFDYLPRAYENGTEDEEAREKMANAATMAGMAFANAFLGVCHSMAHKLGGFYHIQHGIANALLLEQVMRFNASETPTRMGTFSQYGYPHVYDKYIEAADVLNINGDTKEEKFESLIKKINELINRVGIKPFIRDYVPDEKLFVKQLDEMSQQAFDDQCTVTNPRYPFISEIREMYLNAYYGL